MMLDAEDLNYKKTNNSNLKIKNYNLNQISHYNQKHSNKRIVPDILGEIFTQSSFLSAHGLEQWWL